MRRRTWLAGAATAALFPQTALRASVSPEAPAPAAGIEIDFEWTDPARARPVPVRLYTPASTHTGTRAPLVLFSHGLGGSRGNYSYFGRYLAAQGLACLHVQHVGSDRRLWVDGSPLAMLQRLRAAAHEDEARARVMDMRFALDQILAGDGRRWIDSERIVVAGHSYGANTSLLLAGAAPRRDGERVDLRDPRLRGAILLSAPPFFGEAAAGDILTSVTVPTLHVTATDDVIRIPGYFSGLEDRLSIFDAVPGTPKCLAVFQGGAHSAFTDRLAPGGYEANRAIKAATCSLAHRFVRSLFGGDAGDLRAWQERHGDRLARFELRTGTAPV